MNERAQDTCGALGVTMRSHVLAVCFGFLAVATPASGATLRVPAVFPTLKAASQSAVLGDTILIAPGTYDQLGQASTIRSGVTVLSEGGRDVTTLTGFGGGGIGFVHNPGTTTPSRMQGLTVNGGAHAIRHYTVVEGNRLITPYRGAGGWWATLSASCEFRGNIIEGDADRRFEMFPDPPAAVVWTFEQNLIKQENIFGSFGFIDGPISQRLVLRNNTGINFQGLDVGQGGQTVIEVVNNLFFGTGGDLGYAELWCTAFPHVTYDIRYNAWWNSVNVSCQYGTGNIFSNPMLCAPSSGDYRLHSTSPCIGAGEGGDTIGAFGIGCGIVSVPSEAPALLGIIRVTPNPVSSSSMVECELTAENRGAASVQVYSPDGRLVARKTLENARGVQRLSWHEIIGAKRLRSGVYYVELSEGSRRIAKSPILILR